VLELPGQLTARDVAERLFERAGPLLDRLRVESLPDGAAVLRRAGEIVAAMSEADQIAVINAHPRIGERAEKLSAASLREQGGGGGDRTPPEVLLRLAHLNEEYEQKFGFRFVVFVDGRSREAIVPLLEARLRGTRDEERRTALREIFAIAGDRLKREES
jgi:OHCU decarboxylase